MNNLNKKIFGYDVDFLASVVVHYIYSKDRIGFFWMPITGELSIKEDFTVNFKFFDKIDFELDSGCLDSAKKVLENKMNFKAYMHTNEDKINGTTYDIFPCFYEDFEEKEMEEYFNREMIKIFFEKFNIRSRVELFPYVEFFMELT